MEIKVENLGKYTVARIVGEIDGKSAPTAQAQLLPLLGSTGKLVLEMGELTYMSSAGLRMLLLLYRQALARQGKIVLVAMREEIRDIMSMTGFLKFFIIYETMDEASKELG